MYFQLMGCFKNKYLGYPLCCYLSNIYKELYYSNLMLEFCNFVILITYWAYDFETKIRISFWTIRWSYSWN